MNQTLLRREKGKPLRLGREIDAGGEGKIYTVVGEPSLVAKIYHRYSPERAAKLECMLANPPVDPTRSQGHISIAWPTERIFDAAGRCIGFLMPYIDTSNSYPLLKLYNPKDRRETLPGFSWLYLLHTARNLVSVLQSLHERGYVVGDLNESNILVTSTALITLVDCDSIQVRSGQRIFLCPVGKPEYTAPELQGCNFSQVERTSSHDNFGLAVIIFLLLMEGRHPFTGIWRGSGTPPTLEANIRNRNFPYLGNSQLLPPKNALPFDILPRSLQHLMRRSLTRERSFWLFFRKRPGPQTWFHALRDVESQLTVCSANRQHIYSNHLAYCPWCERMRSGIPDPFPQLSYNTQRPKGRDAARLPRSQRRLTHRLASVTFSWLLPLLLLVVEGMLWYSHRASFNQWFVHFQNPIRIAILAAILLLPFVISFLLRALLSTGRGTHR